MERYRRVLPGALRFCKGHVAFKFLFGVVNGLNTGHYVLFSGPGSQYFADFGQTLILRDGRHQFRVDPVRRFAGLSGQRSNLGGIGDAGLIAKPPARGAENEQYDGATNNVILPYATLIVPQNETPEDAGHRFSVSTGGFYPRKTASDE